MAETTPIRDEQTFAELQLTYLNRRYGKVYAVLATFLRYLMAEDQIYCRVPDHESYAGQVILMRKVESSARWFERTSGT